MFSNESALNSARSFKSSRTFFVATYRRSRQEYMVCFFFINNFLVIGAKFFSDFGMLQEY